jgi:transcriptional regulator with XRE-family HTH domain
MASDRPPLQVAFGRALKARRAELGISQEEVSRRSLLARSYVSGAETGSINVSIGNAQRLASAIDLTLSELFARAERLLPRSD